MNDGALVIQLHLGMYVPSLFTGLLIRKVGLTVLLYAGIALNLAAVVINLTGETMLAYGLSLLLVGSDGTLCLLAARRCSVCPTVIMSEKKRRSGRNQPFHFLRDSHIRSGRDAGLAGMEAAGSDDDTGFTGMPGLHLAVQSDHTERKDWHVALLQTVLQPGNTAQRSRGQKAIARSPAL
jgi:hypothetical protein